MDEITPRLWPMAANPALERKFQDWSRSRNEFHEAVKANPPSRPADKWQKLYYRGLDPDGAPGTSDHQSRNLPRAFLPAQARPGCPAGPTRQAGAPASGERLARRQYALRQLSPRLRDLPRSRAITRAQFLDAHFAANWPLLLHQPPPPLAGAGEAIPRDAKDGFLTAAAPPGLAGAGPVQELCGMEAPAYLLGGAAGACAPLTQTPVNRLIQMVAGRKRVILVHPAVQPDGESGMAFDLTLQAGDVLFLPIGWWSRSQALEACVSAVYDQFPWPHEG